MLLMIVRKRKEVLIFKETTPQYSLSIYLHFNIMVLQMCWIYKKVCVVTIHVFLPCIH